MDRTRAATRGGIVHTAGGLNAGVAQGVGRTALLGAAARAIESHRPTPWPRTRSRSTSCTRPRPRPAGRWPSARRNRASTLPRLLLRAGGLGRHGAVGTQVCRPCGTRWRSDRGGPGEGGAVSVQEGHRVRGCYSLSGECLGPGGVAGAGGWLPGACICAAITSDGASTWCIHRIDGHCSRELQEFAGSVILFAIPSRCGGVGWRV